MCAPTHVASKNMRCEGVETITTQRLHNRFLKYGAFEYGTLVINEVSQVSTQLWHAIIPLSMLVVQIICMGNPEDQLLPVQDSFMDQHLELDISSATMLKLTLPMQVGQGWAWPM